MLTIYNQVRTAPKEALKEIAAGRMKGKSDINPMWRIKVLTEMFGPCGIGWWYVIKKSWLEPGGNGEIAAFVEIDLYYRWGGSESQPIPGTGGSSFVANERNGAYVSDECFKMALTDAISVACKALGVAGDVYWSADKSKYDKPPQQPTTPVKPQTLADVPSTPKPDKKPTTEPVPSPTIEEKHRKALYANYKSRGILDDTVKAEIKTQFGKDTSTTLTVAEFQTLMKWVDTHPKKELHVNEYKENPLRD